MRLVAQRIGSPGWPGAAEAVGWLTAVQAQDFPGAVLAVALRTRARERSTVEDALNSGTVVRSWPMRGTLHLVLAADLPWLLELTAARNLATTGPRLRQLEIDDEMVDRAGTLAVKALEGGRSLSRSELLAVWDRAGLLGVNQRGAHLLLTLSHRGLLVFGPVVDGGQHVVLISEWVREGRRLGRDLDRDEALGELAGRYFRSHGPATVRDFTNWTKLLASDVRTALALARPGLTAVEAEGVEYLMDPGTPALLARHRKRACGVHLLPGFDEFMLGYTSRGLALPSEHSDRIVPGGNGMFLPTVVSDGQVVGTWKRAPARGKEPAHTRPVIPSTFGPCPPELAAAIEREAERLPR
jgi:hypothetical protein